MLLIKFDGEVAVKEEVEIKTGKDILELLEKDYKKPEYAAAFEDGKLYVHNQNTCSWFKMGVVNKN